MLRRRDFLLSAGVTALFSGLPKLALAGTPPLQPPKLFDSHAHLVSDDQTRYPRVPSSAPPPFGGGLPAGVGGQASARFAFSPRAEPDVERVVKWMNAYGLVGVGAVQKRGTYGLDNSYILDSADKYPALFVPIVVLDARDQKTPDILRSLIRDHGLAGLRLTGGPAPDGSFPWLNSPEALNVWTVIEESGLVMDLMLSTQPRSEAGIRAIVDLARMHPHARVVLDHVAFPNAEGAPDYGLDAIQRLLATQKNIYVKITSINLDILRETDVSADAFVRKVVDVFGPDRVMWGSDLGNSSGAYPELIERMIMATRLLSKAERRKVMHDTAKRTLVRGGIRRIGR